MAELQPIIVKKKKGGHAAAHGGAWKVAYADFVTAMMAFFLVMWLLGSDEETRVIISHYFNNPTTPWRPDLASKDSPPLGERTGAGENVLSGAEGRVPADLVDRPVRRYATNDSQDQKVEESFDRLLSDEDLVDLDLLKFSIPEDLLFQSGATDEWTPQAERILTRVGKLTRKYKGKLVIKGFSNPSSSSGTGSYEFQMSRAVAISKYMVANDWIPEERVSTSVGNQAQAQTKPRIEFTLH